MFFQLTTKQQLLVSIVYSFVVISDSSDTIHTQQASNKTLKIPAKWRYFSVDIAG